MVCRYPYSLNHYKAIPDQILTLYLCVNRDEKSLVVMTKAFRQTSLLITDDDRRLCTELYNPLPT